MRRLLTLTSLPILVIPFSALASEESLHSFNLSFSQYDETLTIREVTKEVSPQSLGAAYTYISPNGLVLRGSIWAEEAEESINAVAKVETDAWGGGVSLAYPLDDFEFELSYTYSRPELNASSGPNIRVEEDSETYEIDLGGSAYYAWGAWSFTPSLLLGYQDTDTVSNERFPSVPLSTIVNISSSSSESGWFASPMARVAYLFELNEGVSVSPSLSLSWTDFFHGDGIVRRTAYGRGVSRSDVEELDSSSDGSGLLSAGVYLSLDSYYVDVSIDETIDLPSIGTQVNLGIGFVW